MTTLSLNPVWVSQVALNPILVFVPHAGAKKDPGDKPRHYPNKHTGWNRKAALEKKQKDAEMLQTIQRQWRILHGLPVEELEKIVPKVVHETDNLAEQMERLATITRGQQILLQQKYDDYMRAIDEHNEQMIQYLLGQIL